jgi:hypothetical protein
MKQDNVHPVRPKENHMPRGLALFHHHDTGVAHALHLDRAADAVKHAADRVSAYFAARQDREIERFINEHGGVMTDDLEREIGRRYCGTSPRNWI